MLKRLSGWLYRITTAGVALLGLGLFLVFVLFVLPAQSQKSALAEEDMMTPDLSLYYRPASLVRLAEALGAGGRQAYVRARFTFDLIWPLVYTFFLVTSTTWLYDRGTPPGSRLRLLNLAPLVTMSLDFLENISTSWVMLRYPQTAPLAAALAGVFTLLKWCFVVGSFAISLTGIGLMVWKAARGKPDVEIG